MKALLESYRIHCNALTNRISELNLQLQTAKTQTEADLLNSRKRLLQTERMEMLDAIHKMLPYTRRD